MNLTSIATIGLPALFVLSCIRHFTHGYRVTKGLPGIRPLFGPLSFWGAVIGTRWWNPGLDYMWQKRKTLYQKYGSDTISVVPIVSGTPFIMTANLDVAKQIVHESSKSVFYKPDEINTSLLFFGGNLATNNGASWRRHRRILNPAFNPITFGLVWKETIRTYYDMMKTEGWSSQDEVYIPALQAYTYKFAFFVITACAFGLPFDWKSPPSSDKGISIPDSLRLILDHTMIMMMAPSWAYKLPIKLLRDIGLAKKTLDNFMKDQVALRRKEMRAQLSLGDDNEAIRKDVFSRLTRASEQDPSTGLSDEELIGNVFVMLFAGHETTANTLAVMMGLLGLYPDIQEEVYQEIITVCGDREPTYEDYPKLEKLLACFLEALRLFPAGSLMMRHNSEDTTLVVPKANGAPGNDHLLLKKGTQVVVDVIGLEYHPGYFPQPEEFRPSRWYTTPSNPKPLEAYTAFSFGPRVCIGQNFSKTEGVAFLAVVLRDWKLEIKFNPGETVEQYRERVLQSRFVMTLTAFDQPIILKKRVRKH